MNGQSINEYTLRDLALYFLKLGTIGFGGPIALIGFMEQDLVETRRWISKEQYLRGLALAQLAPGPLAAQLAIYIGYIKYRITGATLIGIAFILPSFVMVVLLGMVYSEYGGLVWIRSLFFGVGAAVIGIIVRSSYRLTKLTLRKKSLLWLIAVMLCGITAYLEREIVWLFLLSGMITLSVYAPPTFRPKHINCLTPAAVIPLLQSAGSPSVDLLTTIFLYFAQAGAFVFGSGLAIVPFLYGGVVQEYHWLNEQQFLDAVAVAMITPGPVVITVGFIGYLVADLPGAIAASAGVFLPVYLFVVVPASSLEQFAENPQLIAFVEGVTAAATGAIAGAAIVLTQRAVTDLPTLCTALATLGILLKFKIPEPVLVLLGGCVGLMIYGIY